MDLAVDIHLDPHHSIGKPVSCGRRNAG